MPRREQQTKGLLETLNPPEDPTRDGPGDGTSNRLIRGSSPASVNLLSVRCV